MKKIINILLSTVLLVGILSSCADFLEPEVMNNATKTQIDELGATNPDAIAVIAEGILQGVYAYTGIYQGRHDAAGQISLMLSSDLMTPDMVQTTNHHYYFDYEIDNRGASYSRPSVTWTFCFTLISKSNEIIDKIKPDVTDPKLKAILGQALAMRAFGLHSAIQRYQQTYIGNEDAPGVPIYLTPNDDEETNISRGTVKKVYERIFKDYTKAYELLADFTRPTKSSVDKSVVAGFMARAYMVTNNWANAEKYALLARTGYSLMNPTEAGTKGYSDISNKEWMWGREVTSETTNIVASFQSHICSDAEGYAGGVGIYKCMDKRLYESIGANDKRRNLYTFVSKISQYVNYKFATTEAWLSDNPYMRVSEMYLIEAEAMVQAGKTGAAAVVMTEFMAQRDPDWSNPSPTVDDIFLQKRIELWGEGVVFYDYIRYKKDLTRNYPGSTHLVKEDLKAGSWRLIYAIPQTELDNNNEINDSDQNPTPTDYSS